MFFPFHIVLVLSNLASSLTTNQDFLRLEAVLKNEFTRNPKMIPAIVRSSFHDIMNFDGILGVGGPRGCILQQPMDQNKQLFGSMKNLQRLVSLHFENGSFTFADVISFAGKVAVEFAYDLGGEKVRWRPGRGECIHQEEALGPNGSISSLHDLQPFLYRYNLTAREMFVLLAGAHGLKGAKMIRKGGNVRFSIINSGKEWIKTTINTIWIYFDTATSDGAAFKGGNLLRLPVDMLFFPSSLREATSVGNNPSPPIDQSPEIAALEQQIIPLAYGSEADFNREFVLAFSKMLEIGTDLGDYF